MLASPHRRKVALRKLMAAGRAGTPAVRAGLKHDDPRSASPAARCSITSWTSRRCRNWRPTSITGIRACVRGRSMPSPATAARKGLADPGRTMSSPWWSRRCCMTTIATCVSRRPECWGRLCCAARRRRQQFNTRTNTIRTRQCARWRVGGCRAVRGSGNYDRDLSSCGAANATSRTAGFIVRAVLRASPGRWLGSFIDPSSSGGRARWPPARKVRWARTGPGIGGFVRALVARPLSRPCLARRCTPP